MPNHPAPEPTSPETPEVTVLGVVDASGLGAGKSPSEAKWTLRFSLEAWRVAGGPVQRQKLSLRRAVTEEELAELRRALPSYHVASLQVRFLGGDPSAPPRATLTRTLPDQPDPELAAIAEALRLPKRTEDGQFGTFTLDRSVDWHEAETRWGDQLVRLTVGSAEGSDEVSAPALAHARELWAARSEWDARVRARMIEELLPLRNETWREEDEPVLSAEEFLAAVKLESITMSAEGAFVFWYGDGDLFWGHSIEVNGSFEDGVKRANIAG